MKTFELTDEQSSKIEKWWKKHIKDCEPGYNNGKRYIFDHSNGIGWVCTAQCNGCMSSKDVTDVSTW